MKLAVISDVHGNYPALQTTLQHVDRWQPDVTVVNGDVVNRGPKSRECWQLLSARRSSHGWHIVGGNHEDYVGHWLEEAPDLESPRFQIYRSSYCTFRQMNGLVSEICDLPQRVEFEGPNGSLVRLTHGTMQGNDDGIYLQTPDNQLLKKIAPAPDVFCTGHTHRPLVRRLNGTLVVNSGSVGTAFDGDCRISYAQLTWRKGEWHTEIVRLNYDRRQAREDFEYSEFWRDGGPLVEIFFQEWLMARPMVSRWAKRYENAVLAGKIDILASVSDFLEAEI